MVFNYRDYSEALYRQSFSHEEGTWGTGGENLYHFIPTTDSLQGGGGI